MNRYGCFLRSIEQACAPNPALDRLVQRRQMTKPATKELFRAYLRSAYLAQMSFQSYLAKRDLHILVGSV